MMGQFHSIHALRRSSDDGGTLHWAGRDGVRPASAPFPTLSLALRPQHLTPIQGYATPPHAHTGMVLLSQHSTRTRILDAVP